VDLPGPRKDLPPDGHGGVDKGLCLSSSPGSGRLGDDLHAKTDAAKCKVTIDGDQ